MIIDGFRVVDATEPLTFTVRYADRSRNSPHRQKNHQNPSRCAFAQAIRLSVRRKTGRLPQLCEVYRTRAYVSGLKKGEHDVVYRYEIPRELRSEIITFDRGGMMQVGEYQLRPITPKAIKRRKRWATLISSGYKSKKKIKSRRKLDNVRPHGPAGKGRF